MSDRPSRLLVVCPSWLGDVVMATPAFRLLRRELPGAFIGALMRPGIDELIAGTDFFDELHIERAHGVMGPKLVAAKVRPRRYDAALLLTNSFSTALVTRLAFIPRRIGYDRDGRGLLLTDRLRPQRRSAPHKGWACIPAVEYYLSLARAIVDPPAPSRPALELATTPAQDLAADAILARAAITLASGFAIINPGANDPAKRWPPDRFAKVAAHLLNVHGLAILINGGPAESELAASIRSLAIDVAGPEFATRISSLPELGITIGALKSLVRRAAVLITNDTGPRHIAAAFGRPCVTLFGPTDHRWTALPPSDDSSTRIDILAEPNLPEGQLANDVPEQCSIDKITLETVIAAADRLLALRAAPFVRTSNG